jgi:uncharacterized repeat protein (TIGR01451 family)
VEPDVASGRIFYLTRLAAGWSLVAYDPVSGVQNANLPLPMVTETPLNLLRWGRDGLAFNVPSQGIFILRTSLIPGGPEADLRLFAEDAPASGIVGSNLTFSLWLANAGPSPASNVVVSLKLPSNASLVTTSAATGTFATAPGGMLYNPGPMAPGAVQGLSVTLVPTTLGRLDLVASAVSDASDPNRTNNVFSTSIPVGGVFGPDSIGTIPLRTTHLVYDPHSRRLYGSVPQDAALFPGTIVPIDPVDGRIERPIEIESEPGLLAVSDDGQYLYAAMNLQSAVQRIHLPSRSIDMKFTLPALGHTVADMEVVPGSPRSVAVATYVPWVIGGNPGVIAYDDGIPRTNGAGDVLAFTFVSPTIAVAYNPGVLPSPSLKLQLSPSGFSVVWQDLNLVNGDPESSGGFVFTTRARVIDPASMTVVTNLPVALDGPFSPGPGLSEPDAAAGRFFFLESLTGYKLRVFNFHTFADLGFVPIDDPVWPEHSLVRCGGDRIAIGSGGNTLIIRTSLIEATDLNASFLPPSRPFVAGENGSLAAEFRNKGPKAASNVMAVLVLPSSATVVSAASDHGPPTILGQQITVQIDRLSTNEAVMLTAFVRFTNTTTLTVTNRAFVSGSLAELFPDDNASLFPMRVSADNDRDGLGDDWEIEFFGALAAQNGGSSEDFDGDGRTNLQEFNAGSDPTDAANELRITGATAQGGTIGLQFHAVTGLRYQLERASSLSGSWKAVGTTLIGEGRRATITDPFRPVSRFYRIRQLP